MEEQPYSFEDTPAYRLQQDDPGAYIIDVPKIEDEEEEENKTTPEASEKPAEPAAEETPTPEAKTPSEKPPEPSKERYNQFGIGALRYLQDSNSIAGNPFRTQKKLGEETGFGVTDTPFDLIRFFGDAGKQLSEAYDNFSKRDERRDSLFSAAGQSVVPQLMGLGAASWLNKATASVPFRPVFRKISNLALRLGIEVGAPQILQEADDPGLLYQKGDGPTMNRLKNAAVDTGFFGLGELVTAIGNANGMRRYEATNPESEKFLKAREEKIAKEVAETTGDPITGPAKSSFAKRWTSEIEEAEKAFKADPDGVTGYNGLINEPFGVPGERLVIDYDADPVASLADRAVMKTDLSEASGQPRPFFTDNFFTNLMNAPKGSARRELIKEQIEASEISFKTMLPGEKGVIPAEVMEETKNDIWRKLTQNLDWDFEEALKEYQLADKVLGRDVQVLTQTSKQAAFEAIDEMLFYMDPKSQRVEALAAQQAAETIQDLSIKEAFKEFDPKRIRELLKPRLQFLYEATRKTTYVEGLRLRLNDITKRMQKASDSVEKASIRSELDELGLQFDVSFKKTKAEALEFVNNYMDLTDRDPALAEALRKAFVLSDGDINTLEKVIKHAKHRTNMGRYIVDMDPKNADFFSKAIEQYQYQNLLNGRTPIRTFIANLSNYLIKPSTSMIGAGLRGDFKGARQAMVAYAVGVDGILDMARMAKTQFKYSQLYPDYQVTTGLRDVYSSEYTEYKPIIDAVKKAGELPAWNQLGWMITTGFKSMQDTRFGRLGVSLLSGIDGINNGWLGHVNARYTALNKMDEDGVLDRLLEAVDNPKLAKELERDIFENYKEQIYSSYLDQDGLLNDKFTKIAGQEINLNGPNDAANTINRVLSYSPLVKGMVKFLPTVGNALTFNFTFIPGASLALKRHRKLFKIDPTLAEKKEAMEMFGIPEEKFSDQRFTQLQNEHLGRWFAWSGLAMTAGFMAEGGMLTGYGPRGKEERKDWLRYNKPYHIKINGEWRSYENMGPITSAIGFAADMSYELKNGHLSTDSFASSMFSLYGILSNNVLNTSTFMDALAPINALLMSGDGSEFTRAVANYTDQWIVGAGYRSWANSLASPEYKELDNNIKQHIENKSKFIFKLPPQYDLYEPGAKLGDNDNAFQTFFNSKSPYLRYGGEATPVKTFLSTTPWNGGFKPYSIDGVPLEGKEKSRMMYYASNYGVIAGKNYVTREVEKVRKFANKPGSKYNKEIKQAKDIMIAVNKGKLDLSTAEGIISNFSYAKELVKIHNTAFTYAKGMLKDEKSALSKSLLDRISNTKQSQFGAQIGDKQRLQEGIQGLINYNSNR